MQGRTFWQGQWKSLVAILAVFLLCFYLPVEQLQQWPRLHAAFWNALYLVRWYAQEHVILCLVPAFFIAGAIAVFLSQEAVMKYLGAEAPKALAYGVAAVSGTILAVCSCTVLPLFASIYRRGAGLGPAIAFLYSGPAINVLAIILTARVLGLSLGVARAIGAILFSVVIGLVMQALFPGPTAAPAVSPPSPPSDDSPRSLGQQVIFFAVLVGILVFANWAQATTEAPLWQAIAQGKWWITGGLGLILASLLVFWYQLNLSKVLLVIGVTAVLAWRFGSQPLLPFGAAIVGLGWLTSTARGEAKAWFESSWEYAQQILPLLLVGVLIAGALLGRPGSEALIPSQWITQAVGGNTIGANFVAAIAGAFMYFATLTEVPILQGLLANGMGQGPALALLLAGPALSLPNMLVIRQIIGWRKTVAYVVLVVLMATLCGFGYGYFWG
ncbi:MAG: permease [Thermosynechococcus sp.]|uniref:permease n=1 Tax=Thermosynechococcus sp. TaxID=2814275 RepID=UPI00391C1F6C